MCVHQLNGFHECEINQLEVISATDELQLVYHCLKLGAADFLTKPIHVKQVENIWQTIWRKKKEEENKAKEQENQDKIQQELEDKVSEAVTTPIKVHRSLDVNQEQRKAVQQLI